MLDNINTFIQIVAFFSAAVFFFYKVISGYFVNDMSLKLETERGNSSEEEDTLCVNIFLSKGERGTIALHDIRAIVSYESQKVDLRFEGTNRLPFHTEMLESVPKKTLSVQKESESSPFINLSPHESTSFACYTKVPKKSLCTVEVAVLGQRPIATRATNWKIPGFLKKMAQKTGQWRASAISLPKRTTPKQVRAVDS